ncbi:MULTISPECIES: DUF4129 domain-containing protein [Streptomyces]|uniref:DUF4129 domain-containing protein n=1 Tax=Streptomyces TaxID=1883 RepID=UPI0004BFBD93|nr:MULTISPECIES: DUF4129 domain-containing protein [Streptomyces]GHJ22313.1 membrane protein [Streptomyces albus]
MPGGPTTVATLHAAVLRRTTARSGDDVPVTTPRLPAREDAERELTKPEYHQHDPNLAQRALNWLWDRIGDLLSTAAGASPGGWIGLLAITVLVIVLLIALRLRLGKLRPQPSTSTGDLFTDRPRTADDHRAAAEAHAAAGHWSAAVQERMRALLRSLEERALLDPRPGRTADEAATEAGRALPGHAAQLRTAARTFDDITYGDRSADQAAYTRLRDLDTGLLSTTPRPAADTASPAPAQRGGPA